MIYELLLIRLNVLKMVRRVSYEDEIKTQVFKLQLMIINLILKLKWIYQSLIHLVKQFSFLSCPFQLCVCQPVIMFLPCLSFFLHLKHTSPLSPPPHSEWRHNMSLSCDTNFKLSMRFVLVIGKMTFLVACLRNGFNGQPYLQHRNCFPGTVEITLIFFSIVWYQVERFLCLSKLANNLSN